jgi:hypothetical protein
MYCDRSEIFSPMKILVVSGLLAELDDWIKVDADWRAVLGRFGVDRFHMTDFEARRGPFKWDEARRIEFLTQLLDTLRDRVVFGLACGIVISDYKKLDREDRQAIRHPYAFCGAVMASQVLRWVDRAYGSHVPVGFVFEAGDEGAGILAEEFSPRKMGTMRDRILSVSFENCRNVMALQAADMLAYEYAKHLPRRIGTDERATRKLIRSIQDVFPIAGVYFAGRGLRDFAEENRLIKACAAAIKAGFPDEATRLMQEFHKAHDGKTGWVDLFSPNTWPPRPGP